MVLIHMPLPEPRPAHSRAEHAPSTAISASALAGHTASEDGCCTPRQHTEGVAREGAAAPATGAAIYRDSAAAMLRAAAACLLCHDDAGADALLERAQRYRTMAAGYRPSLEVVR